MSEALHKWDPDGIAATAGPRHDEYEAEAVRLVPRLDRAMTRQDFAEAAWEWYPRLPDEILDRWWAAFSDFRRSDDLASPRKWPWRLGFALAIVWAWVWIGLYFLLVGLGSMADCFGMEPCTTNQRQEIADAITWGEVFAACTLVATVLGFLAAEGRRRAAAVLSAFCVIVIATTFPQPSGGGTSAGGAMVYVLGPMLGLAVWRWWSSRKWQLGAGSAKSG